MVNRGVLVSLFVCASALSAGPLAAQQTTQPARDAQTQSVVGMLLDRSRLLQDVQFEVPVTLYQDYLRDIAGMPAEAKAPVAHIAESGLYTLTVDKDRNITLTAELHIRVFDPQAATNLPVLSAKLAWAEVTVDGKATAMATTDGFLRWSPGKSGLFTIAAKAPLPKAPAIGGQLGLNVPQTTRTQVAFESPAAWQVQPDFSPSPKQAKQSSDVELGQIKLIGTAANGTHGRLALPPANQITVHYFPPTVQTARASRYELSGDVAWNIDAAAQQVAADLKIAIGGGASDRFELLLGDSADRVSVTGPEVQQVQVTGGRAVVFLRGKVLGATPIKLSYELPLGTGTQRAMGRLDITDGHWSAGTLVVTNTAGGSEVLPATPSGLTETSPFDIPDSAKALLAGPAVLAYQVTSRQFEATVEVLQLGQFALRQSLADLAHFETFLDRDGAMIGRARYEIRNRNKQFLRVNMPAGATVLLARVNEKSVPVTPVAGQDGQYMLKLERSLPSVKGLVSFPVEIVYTARVGALRPAGTADIPLPAIDLPIAYAWCQSYLPDGVEIRSVAGPMKRVDQFSSQTAKASLDYGYGTMAEGYTEGARPTAATAAPARPLTSPVLTLFNGQQAYVTVPDGGTLWGGGHKTPAEGGPDELRALNRRANDSLAKTTEALAATRAELEKGKSQRQPPATQPVGANVDTNLVIMKDRSPDGRYATMQPANHSIDGETALRRDGAIKFYNQPDGSQGAGNEKMVAGLNKVSTEEINAGLARNYYRAGKDFYDKGDYDNASRSLGNTVKLAPGSIEAENADRLLANVKTLKGDVSVFGKTGSAQKAAVREVQQQATEKTRGLERQQEALVEQAMNEARAGQTSAAKNTLQAAQGINRDINLSNSANLEAQAQGKEIAEKLKAVSKIDQAEIDRLNAQMDQLAAAGQYDQATLVANSIRIKGGSTPELQRKLETIAIAQARNERQNIKDQSSPNAPGKIANALNEPPTIAGPVSAPQFTGAAVPAKGTSGWGSAKGQPQPTVGVASSSLTISGGTLSISSDSELGDSSISPATGRSDGLRKAGAGILTLSKDEQQRDSFDRKQANVAASEAERSNTERVGRINEQKRSSIAALKARAKTLQAEQKYDEALDVLDQILQLDPNDAYAAGSKDTLAVMRDLHSEKTAYDDMRSEWRKSEIIIREAEIPWSKELQYPKNWRELTAKREAYGANAANESEADRAVRMKLRNKIPRLDFNSMEFGDVIEFFRTVSGVNFHPNWQALAAASVDRKTPVNLSLSNVTADEALGLVLADLGTNTKIGYLISDGAVVITTQEDLVKQPLVKAYDVSDLVFAVPDSGGLVTNPPSISNNNAPARNTNMPVSGTHLDDVQVDFIVKATRANQNEAQRIIDIVRQTVGEDSWQKVGGDIREVNGQLVVTQTAENQRMIADVLAKIRQARGPQVQIDNNIAQQRASGTLTLNGANTFDGGTTVNTGTLNINTSNADVSQALEDPKMRKFIASNYGWAGSNNLSLGVTSTPDTDKDKAAQLVQKLQSNLGQKVAVNSMNLNVSPTVAQRAGVQFKNGDNLQWATIDEAQFRTLMELDAQAAASGLAVNPSNGRLQETIVGTDALLANGFTGNLAFAGERGNSFTINGNPLSLPHESYLLINNGGYLTAVKAAPMQHWTTPVTEVMFAPVPQAIEVPRVGQLVNLEKTLLESNDRLVIKAEYFTHLGSRQ